MKTITILMLVVLKGAAKGMFKLIHLAFWGETKKPIKIPISRSHRVPVVSNRVMKKHAGLAAQTKEPSVLQQNDFEVADQIIAIRFDPPVGVVHMRVFAAARVVKRDLIIHDPVLKGIMRGRRFTLPDSPYVLAAGLDPVKDETVALAEKLINDVGNRNVKCVKPPKHEVQKKADAEPKKAEANKSVPVAPKQEPREMRSASEMPKPKAPVSTPAETKIFQPRATTGFTYVGHLKNAQHRKFTPAGRPSYETYEATILMDNGAEMPMRGAELEREIESAGCAVGDRVSITPMGKVPVTLPDGKEGSKNLYKVVRLGSA